MPLDHFNINVPQEKLEGVIEFLLKALEHMEFKEIMRPLPHVVGLGEGYKPYLWLIGVEGEGTNQEGWNDFLRANHVAFAAKDVRQVRQFHAAGLKAGGEDNGKPGRRPEYHPQYYGAFVRDPVCGINFEAVIIGCPEDEGALKKLEEEADA